MTDNSERLHQLAAFPCAEDDAIGFIPVVLIIITMIFAFGTTSAASAVILVYFLTSYGRVLRRRLSK